MAPVLKVDPSSGESLDRNRSIEEVAAEIARKTKELEEYRDRVKTKKPRKKKVEPEEESIVVKPAEPIIVKVDPLNAPNREVVVEELLEPLNAILDNIEHKLQMITKGFKFQKIESGLASVDRPKEFTYKPSVTRTSSSDEDVFNLIKPSGVTSLKFEKFTKDIYIDRVLLNPVEIRELLKDENAESILTTLIIDGMFKNLFETKQLDSGRKKYIGTYVATIKRPGMDKNYAREYRGDLSFIEIRLFSDITEVK